VQLQAHTEFKAEFVERFKRKLGRLPDQLRENNAQKTNIRDKIKEKFKDLEGADVKHFQGLVGEMLLQWTIESYRPQSRKSAVKTGSSTEHGKDMLELIGHDPSNIQLVIWEAKSTENRPSNFTTKLRTFFKNRARNAAFDTLEQWAEEATDQAWTALYEFLKTEVYKNDSTHVYFGAFVVCDTQSISNRTNDMFPSEIPVPVRLLAIFEVRSYEDTIKEWKDTLWQYRLTLIGS
jgi:hypothetical protein